MGRDLGTEDSRGLNSNKSTVNPTEVGAGMEEREDPHIYKEPITFKDGEFANGPLNDFLNELATMRIQMRRMCMEEGGMFVTPPLCEQTVEEGVENSQKGQVISLLWLAWAKKWKVILVKTIM